MRKSSVVLFAALGIGVLGAGFVGYVMTAPARTPLKVTELRLSPSTFSVSPPGAARNARSRRPTTIRFRLSSPARVKIVIAARRSGKRSGRRCAQSTPSLQTRPSCDRYVAVGSIAPKNRKSGQVKIGFSGRVRGRPLQPGPYRAAVTARDKGSHSRRTTAFSVVDPTQAPGGAAPAPPPGGQGQGQPAPAPAAGGFPNPSTTGVPAGWKPTQVRSTDLQITQPGAVVQDIELDGADLLVQAPNVTVRRVDFEGGGINNLTGDTCGGNGLTVEDTTFEPPRGQTDPVDQQPAILYAGYTARRVKLWRRGEGFFVAGKPEGCGPVRIENSFAKLVVPDSHCGPGTDDWHTDGIQGYYGPPLIVSNTTVDANEAKCGTAPFFYPHSQGNTSVDVNRLLVMGGGYSFRLGMPGPVQGLRIVDKSWLYGPYDVKCSVVKPWEAQVVTIDASYQVTKVVKQLPCDTEAGN